MEYYKLLFYYLSYSCPNGSLVYQFCPFYIKKWKPKRPPQKTQKTLICLPLSLWYILISL